MIYAAMTFWLLIIVFAAYGIYQLWSDLVRPKIINALLLPGTLVAQLGHIFGLLITGGTVNNARLIKDDETGEPTTSEDAQSQIPVVGPVIIALLPMLACGISIYVVVSTIGSDILSSATTASVSEQLPMTMPAFWQLLRSSIDAIEQVTVAVLNSDFSQWQTWLFVYLIICLTVRMAPLPGTHRGAVWAILLFGVLFGVISLATQLTQDTIHSIWNILSFNVAVLLFLMMLTLIVRGGIGLVKILANRE